MTVQLAPLLFQPFKLYADSFFILPDDYRLDHGPSIFICEWKGDRKFIAHLKLLYGFKNGAVGLDMNYNFVSLCNVDEEGNFKSYHEVKFRNLHSYRTQKSSEYISYKMDKVVNYCINKKKGLVIEDLTIDQEFSYGKKRNRKKSN